MSESKQVVRCNGRTYKFRRRLANPAIVEVVDRHIARGWLVHRVTMDDVEVYNVHPSAPHYSREIPASDEMMKAMVREILESGLAENWKLFREGAIDLAHELKRLGFPRKEFVDVMTRIEQKLAEKRDDPLFPEKIREAMRKERWRAAVSRAH
jgi:hypothetical protein